MNILAWVGQTKYKLIRVVAYIQIFNSGLLIYLAGWHWFYLLLIPIFWGLYLFETKFGIPGELDVAWKSSKEWQEYKREFEELKNFIMDK